MRFVWAVAAFVLAALMVGTGIAQRTVLQGPKTDSQAIEVASDAPYVLIDGGVLTSHDGAQNLRVQENGTIFAAYGRTTDLHAWLAPSDYTQVSVEDGEIVSTAVSASTRPAADAQPMSPIGSDLWLDEFQQDDVLITPLQLPADMSLLVATDGIEPAPSTLSVSWPTGATTPWAGPLIVGGSILLLIGLVLYVLGVRHARRSKGPRRKGLPLPVTEPINLAVDQVDKGVISASPTRKQLSRGTRSMIAIPALALSGVLMAGCSADAWPQLGSTPSPSASEVVVIPEDQGSPAVTEAQAERIIARISEQVATADAALDPAAAAVRLSGTALAVRETDYKLRATLPDTAPPPTIPGKPVRVILPEAFDGWPRTFFAVIETSATTSDVIVSVTQNDPWSPYKLSSSAELIPDASLNLAPSYVGAVAIDPASPFLVIAPNKLAAAYADVIDHGAESQYAALFDEQSDPLRADIARARADSLAQFNETGAQTGAMTFAVTPGEAPPVALATLDSGAIIAVTVNETETVASTNPDAVIKLPDNNVKVQTLTGVTQSATGFTTTYADQLYFFVPAQSSNGRIQLLAYSSSFLDAKVPTP